MLIGKNLSLCWLATKILPGDQTLRLPKPTPKHLIYNYRQNRVIEKVKEIVRFVTQKWSISLESIGRDTKIVFVSTFISLFFVN